MGTAVGVALVEVLVSISVMGIGMGALLRTTSVCVRTEARAEERALACRLAEAKTVELRQALAGGGGMASGGPFPAPWAAYEWTSALQESRGDTPFALLSVEVSRDGKGMYRTQVPVVLPER